MTVYRIPNCNTVKKALEWLKNQHIEFSFHDYKKKGITEEKLNEWIAQVGWESLVNKKGTTWRMLSPEEQAKVANQQAAVELIIQKPSVTKRPILESDGKVIAIGFDEERYGAYFNK